nr:MAG TPA: hypothetical protein [Caudoviricetes sp.]
MHYIYVVHICQHFFENFLIKFYICEQNCYNIK